MACSPVYVGLPCHLSGVGFAAESSTLGSATLKLQTGHGLHFPEVVPGQFFYAVVTDPCSDCCETVRVIGRTGDTLTIQRDAPSCGCFKANARVRYVSNTKDAVLAIASEAPINVQPPLVWNCETRTLSIDCNKLHEMINNPCA